MAKDELITDVEEAIMSTIETMPIEEVTINTIRTLSMDAVEAANSGHPGTPMALAPLIYLLYAKIMKHNPKNPHWFNRDRFLLSAGHASMLLYSILHLCNYDMSLAHLRHFRQLGSKTPGHPEYGLIPGIETTTGPLGQGIANAIGIAIAEAHLAATFNTEEHKIVDHYTYSICSDGDLMEGISHEVASLAGHLGLGKLIWFYDDNHITIEGSTDLSYSDNVKKRFEAYGWQVINVGDKANDLEAILKAVDDAKNATEKPSLIIIRSHIAFGSPNFQDKSEAHGAPLGEDEIRLTKKKYNWPENAKFLIPTRVKEHMDKVSESCQKYEDEWNAKFVKYKKANPGNAAQLEQAITGELPIGWDSEIPVFKAGESDIATRNASGKILNAIAENTPFLIGGSADLSPSTKTFLKTSGYFSRKTPENKNIAWGVRELGMAAASSGIALHGGLRPFCSTFFVFSDYARPAIRLAAMMKAPVIYVMTHDSIGVGEDGPTHQPVEQLMSLRTIPGLTIIRPADANETAYAWRAAMQRKRGPTMLVLSRQDLPIIDRTQYASSEGTLKGAYILSREIGAKADFILIASGSEVHLALKAQKQLADDNIDARVVSMPSWELFHEQSLIYKQSILPSEVKPRLAIEATCSLGWRRFVGDSGSVIGMDQFGTSGPYKKVFPHFGFSVENIVDRAKHVVNMMIL